MNDLGASVIVNTHIDNSKPNDRSTAIKRQINRIDYREHIEFDVFTPMSYSGIFSDSSFRFSEPGSYVGLGPALEYRNQPHLCGGGDVILRRHALWTLENTQIC